MKRRGFLSALVALPVVGGLARVGRRRETYTVTNVDGSQARFAVADPYVPKGQIWIVGSTMLLPIALAARLPRPDMVIGASSGGAQFKAWSLEGDMFDHKPNTDAIAAVLA